MQKREAAPAKRKLAEGGGMWQRVKSFFGVSEAKDREAPLDCAAVRQRVETLRVQLEGAGSDPAARLTALRKAQTELSDVVRVLLAGGDTSAELLALSKHVGDLAQMLASNPADDVVNRYHEGIVLALRGWLGLPQTPTPAGREGFWK